MESPSGAHDGEAQSRAQSLIGLYQKLGDMEFTIDQLSMDISAVEGFLRRREAENQSKLENAEAQLKKQGKARTAMRVFILCGLCAAITALFFSQA